jgi:hypothetical protein
MKGDRDWPKKSGSRTHHGATYYEEGAPATYWQDQLCQEVYFQSFWADIAFYGVGEN